MRWLAAWPLPLLALAHLAAGGFLNITKQAGIEWRHASAETREHFLTETTTGGAGFLDFDNDGLLDIFLPANSANSSTARCALYRNLGNGRFEDAAAKAGVAKLDFAPMAVASADYDNDGLADLYVSGYPSGALFHNNGNGTFTNVTAKAGVANSGEWGASAAWLDYDRDGRLDLFIADYVEFSYTRAKHCDFAGEPAYCAQTEYQGSRSRLYHNNGDGTFTDVSAASGIGNLPGRALGVVAIDADGDGWIDLFVARDASPNLLWINQRNGTFRDVGIEKEIAYNADGVARSGMGVDAADLNGDGLPDFVVTNFDHEYHALYLSQAHGPYVEATVSSGLARFTRPYVGWGVRFLDFDNDGSLDLLIANGHMHRQIARSNREVSYREPPLLLKNSGKGEFAAVAGSFETGMLGRGLAVGDFDNDGAMDALIVDLDGPPLLLRNTNVSRNRWLGVSLRGTRGNRDAIGARLTLHTARGKLTRWVTGGASFLSSHDRRIVFGLGTDPNPGTLEIRWPGGRLQYVTGLTTNRYSIIEEPE